MTGVFDWLASPAGVVGVAACAVAVAVAVVSHVRVERRSPVLPDSVEILRAARDLSAHRPRPGVRLEVTRAEHAAIRRAITSAAPVRYTADGPTHLAGVAIVVVDSAPGSLIDRIRALTGAAS